VRFGGISKVEAKVKYQDQVVRDLKKKQAAEKAGWTYVIFKYDEKDISVSSLMDKIATANSLAEGRSVSGQDRNVVSQQIKQKNKPKRDDSYHKKQLKRAKEYRKQQYKKYKERQNETK
jgi:hypothetical protein